MLGILILLAGLVPCLPLPPRVMADPPLAPEDSWFPLQPGARLRYRVLNSGDFMTWIVREDPRPGFVRLETLRHHNGERAWSALRVGTDGIRFVEMHSIGSPGDSLRSYPEWRFFAPPEEGDWAVDCYLRRFLGGRYVGAPDARTFAYHHGGIAPLVVQGRTFETLRVDQDPPVGRPEFRHRVWYARGIGPVRIEAIPMAWGFGTLELAPEDLRAPEPVGEVSIREKTPFEVFLSWDMPADDQGIPCTRETRMAEGAPGDFDWETARPIGRDWAYAPAMARDSVLVDNLVPGREFVVGIRYADDLGNLQADPRLVPFIAPAGELLPGNYLPLTPGTERTYLIAGGADLVWRVQAGDLGADRIVNLTRSDDPDWRVRLGLGTDDDGVELQWIGRGEAAPRAFEPPVRLLRRPGPGRAWSFEGRLEAVPEDPEPDPRQGRLRVLGQEEVDLAEARVEAARIREMASEVRGYDHWYAPGVGLIRSDRFPFLPEVGWVLLAPPPDDYQGDDDGGDGDGGGGKELIPAVLSVSATSPFRDRAAIELHLTEPRHVRMEVFDPLGREVARLRDEDLSAGDHDFSWNGRSGCGRPLPAGVYVIRLSTGNVGVVRKVVKLP